MFSLEMLLQAIIAFVSSFWFRCFLLSALSVVKTTVAMLCLRWRDWLRWRLTHGSREYVSRISAKVSSAAISYHQLILFSHISYIRTTIKAFRRKSLHYTNFSYHCYWCFPSQKNSKYNYSTHSTFAFKHNFFSQTNNTLAIKRHNATVNIVTCCVSHLQ